MSTVIPIDGPTSSGKSSVGYLFSKKIGFQYIDSGAIFRAGTIQALKENVPLDNADQLAQILAKAQITFSEIDNHIHTFLNGQDITNILHDPEVTRAVPIISMFSQVRQETTKLQRSIASKKNTVMAGRDIGTEIFPTAKLKFYLTADIQIRAFRRLAQLREKDPNISYEQVLEEMIDRDKKDMIRPVSPLRIAKDAVIIDTSTLTSKQSVEKMLKSYRQIFR